MLRYIFMIALSAGMCSYALVSCQHEPYDVNKGNFPEEISNILVRRCATEGCHDAAGAVNAAGLRLDNWDELFKGSARGAVVVPYSTTYSILLYYINQESFSNRDLVAVPTMPYNATPLTEEEYNVMKNWIANGAPDAAGNIAFASEADTRQKIYITQQTCEDLLTVVDAKSGLVMRYVPMGSSNNTENAHNVKVSPDGKYAYICFVTGTVLQKIDTRTDAVVETVEVGIGSWNVMHLSPDGNKLLLSDRTNNRVLSINTTPLAVTDNYNGNFIEAHGIASMPTFDTFFFTSQFGNVVYRFIPDDQSEPIKEISIDGEPVTHSNVPGLTPNPHEILMTPDHSKYFLTCENSKQVRVLNSRTDEILAAIDVGFVPKEMVLWEEKNLLFVTCLEDPENKYTANSRGSVYIIDIKTLQKVGAPIYGDFFQPHGLAIDKQNKLLYVASENISPNGPAPHHGAVCNGRNGWYTIYDLNTMQPFSKKRYEITPDPYGVDSRFK